MDLTVKMNWIVHTIIDLIDKVAHTQFVQNANVNI